MKPSLTFTSLLARSIAFALPCIATISSSAQTAPSTPSGTQDPALQLSAFSVVSTKDDSYTVSTATAALKTTQNLLDIASPIQVMPRAVIDDLGFDWLTTDYARFVSSGLNSYGANNVVYLRGQKQSWMFKDGVQYFPSVDDDFSIETVEVVKGINASLFGTLPAVSGMVLETTKQPMETEQTSVKLMANGDGSVLRSEVDATGPLSGSLLGAKVSYRLLLAAQDGDMKQIYDDDRLLISPSFTLDWKHAILRVRYEYSDITDFGLYTNNFLDQNGKVSTIGGRDETYKAPWSRARFKKGEFETNLTNIYTPDFQSNLQVSYTQELRSDHDNRAYLVATPGSTTLNGNVVIPVTTASTMASTVLQLSQNQYTYSLSDDYVANYSVLGSAQQTNFGFNASYLYNSQALIQPYLGSISVVNPVLPTDPGLIAIPGADDTIAITQVADFYFQDQAKFFSDRLTLTAGGAWAANDTTSHKAVAVPTYSESKGDKLTYKVAANYKLSQSLALYTSRATAFVPQAPGIADANGNPLAPISSIDEEVGIKTESFFNGLISGSIGGYRSTTFNQSVVVNAGTASAYYASSGRTDTRGLEYDLTISPITGWEVIGTLFQGDGVFSSATAAYANRTYKNTWSVLTKYRVASGVLKGLVVGADAYHMGAVYVVPAPAYPAWTIYGAFISYTLHRIQFGVNVDNLTNEVYDAGGNSRYQVAIGSPRELKLSAKYSF